MFENIDWENFDVTKDVMIKLQQRIAAQYLASFVLIVMPEREFHPEQEKNDQEMSREVQKLALDFIQNNETYEDAYDSELVQKFIEWNHHEMVLRVKKSFEKLDEQHEGSVH